MPIRLNLLAEAQAAEELRRKDPVKRAIFLGGACVALMAAVSLLIQSQIMRTNANASTYDERIQAMTNEFGAVMANDSRLRELQTNIRGLDILASERFLNGTLLNALQKVYVDNVQLTHLDVAQSYTLVDESKAKPAASGGSAKAAKPATATEKVVIVIEARDTSANPGDRVTDFKKALGRNAYIQQLIGTNNEMRLINLSPPQLLPDLGRPVVQFTLEARLPEKTRLDITSSARYAAAPADKAASKPKATEDLKL